MKTQINYPTQGVSDVTFSIKSENTFNNSSAKRDTAILSKVAFIPLPVAKNLVNFSIANFTTTNLNEFKNHN